MKRSAIVFVVGRMRMKMKMKMKMHYNLFIIIKSFSLNALQNLDLNVFPKKLTNN